MRRVVVLFAATACGSPTTTMPPAKEPAKDIVQQANKPPPADPTPPEFRLPKLARPLHETVELAIDPTKEDFSGTITTELEVLPPTNVLWLNADEITVDKATIGTATARAIGGQKDYLGLVVDPPLQPGKTTMTIAYHGKAHLNDGDGIYTAKEGEDMYAFTQFESTSARQAFPCFDEPSYKIPWQVSIKTKKDLVVLSNTLPESETDAGNGDKLTKFGETKPLPSYLVAFAVGPFEAVDAGKTRSGAPIRIVVPRGHTGEVGYAAENTKPLLDRLEDYFGTPYPYSKLDLLAVPVFNAGAMENVGLITFRQSILEVKPAEVTIGTQERFATVAAHEMAHQWFGDLVTLAWWDDTWLNESFATWMEAKIVAGWKPEWDPAVGFVSGKLGVEHADSLESANAVRQPIEKQGDINGTFDPQITYGKGEAVLTMLEARIGADVFQKGVRAYLKQHAYGNATYDDFVGAMSTASGSNLQPVFDAFIKQSGVPLLSVSLDCKGAPKLSLSQRRYAPIGSSIDTKRTWQLPVCVRWGAGKTTGRECTTLTSETGELALSAKTCPDWVEPNDGGLGYYIVKPDGKLLDQLLAKATALTLPERIDLIGEVNSLVGSGEVDNGKALALAATLAKDPSRHIVDASISIVTGIDEMVPDNLEGKYEKLIVKLFGARAHELGWHSKPKEDADKKELRPRLVGFVAGSGKDPQLLAEATKLTWKWLDDHSAIEADLVGTVLSVAASHGDQKLFDRFHDEAKKATDRNERARYLGAMAAFEDPKIVAQAMQLVVSDEFDLRESMGLLQGGFANKHTRMAAFAFVKDHFDAISEKLPPAYRPYMAYTIVALCDDDKKKEVDEFFTPKIEKLDGGPRIMKQALEAMSLCSAQRKAQAPGVVTFLSKQ